MQLKESILLIKNKSVALEIKKRISSVDQKNSNIDFKKNFKKMQSRVNVNNNDKNNNYRSYSLEILWFKLLFIFNILCIVNYFIYSSILGKLIKSISLIIHQTILIKKKYFQNKYGIL
jgi:hypothetical protein